LKPKLGLNMSRITENTLKAYINRLKDIRNEIIKTSSSKPKTAKKTENNEKL